MKISLFIAMSLNGMISRKNGEEDFLADINWQSFKQVAKDHGCFVIGRKTYETVKDWNEPDYSFEGIDARLKLVVSKNTDLKLEAPFMQADSPRDAIAKAEEQGFGSLLVVGGSTLNGAFLKENLVDEMILNIEPVIISQGIPLITADSLDVRLELLEVKQLTDGVQQFRYAVKK